jgi:hypothetical protein
MVFPGKNWYKTIVTKERIREKPVPFTNEHCSFVPVSWINIEKTSRPVAYKVVTENIQSLGLRRNPNIMTFIVGDWTSLPDDQLLMGKTDRGGIWSKLTLAGARATARYMAERHNQPTRIFLVEINNPLFANSDRVKSQGVFLLEELR